MSARWRVAALLLAGIGAACGADHGADRARMLENVAARRFAGVWDVTFHADSQLGFSRHAPDALVTGTLAFTEDVHGPTDVAELAGVTHTGVYDLDFRPFGWETRSGNEAAVAVARVLGATGVAVAPAAADSFYVVLSPGTQRFAVRMAGTIVGDSCAGTWSASSFSAGGGAGTFVMRHRAGSR